MRPVGHTPLRIAVDLGHIATVQVLLEPNYSAVDVNAADRDGISVLQSAVIGGHVRMCCALLQRGADPNQPDRDGDTPWLCDDDDDDDDADEDDADEDDADEDGHDHMEDDTFDDVLVDVAEKEEDDDDEEDEEELSVPWEGHEQDSIVSWKTDFTPSHDQRVVDVVPSTLEARQKKQRARQKKMAQLFEQRKRRQAQPTAAF
jgi:Ankyrin repeats (3 copies)